jgi:hypothetical protein
MILTEGMLQQDSRYLLYRQISYGGNVDVRIRHISEELSEFYEGLAFVSKTDANIRLYIDAFLSGEDWHGHIVGAPELVITKNILDVIKNVSPQGSGRAYSE